MPLRSIRIISRGLATLVVVPTILVINSLFQPPPDPFIVVITKLAIAMILLCAVLVSFFERFPYPLHHLTRYRLHLGAALILIGCFGFVFATYNVFLSSDPEYWTFPINLLLIIQGGWLMILQNLYPTLSDHPS